MSHFCFVPALLCLAVAAASNPAWSAEEHSHHAGHQPLKLAPRVITAVQQDSPLTIVTDPKQARQRCR